MRSVDVDIRTLSADRLAKLRTEAGEAGDADLVAAIDSIKDAPADTLDALNAYEGDNIWQDIIMRLDGYDDDASLDAGAEQGSDVFVADGVTYRYDPQAYPSGAWVVAR